MYLKTASNGDSPPLTPNAQSRTCVSDDDKIGFVNQRAENQREADCEEREGRATLTLVC